MKAQVARTVTAVSLLVCLGCTTLIADHVGDPSRLYRGELRILVADDFQRGTAQTHYLMISATDGAILGLDFPKALPDPPLRSGTRVEIRGRRIKDRLIVETLRVPSTAAPAP